MLGLAKANAMIDVFHLLQVQAVYDYEPCDDDELAFKIGDTINIVDFDDPDDEVRRLLEVHSHIFFVL